MTTYIISPEVFERFPTYRRGVVFVDGVKNSGSTKSARILADAVHRTTGEQSPERARRIDVWNDAYRKLGIDPNVHTPSIRFLFEQIGRGKPPRSINPLVDLFNATSLTWILPCGGDDLAAVPGEDIILGLATGVETFSPLFKPLKVESPEPGEVIYFARPSNRVFCRRWTWRNADFSKLGPQTTRAAVNIDVMLPAFTMDDLHRAMEGLASQISGCCGGNVTTHLLSPESPSFVMP
jgi:DNA/RNA-binding domain of Phe-tRNA-synthetase-like protein